MNTKNFIEEMARKGFASEGFAEESLKFIFRNLNKQSPQIAIEAEHISKRSLAGPSGYLCLTEDFIIFGQAKNKPWQQEYLTAFWKGPRSISITKPITNVQMHGNPQKGELSASWSQRQDECIRKPWGRGLVDLSMAHHYDMTRELFNRSKYMGMRISGCDINNEQTSLVLVIHTANFGPLLRYTTTGETPDIVTANERSQKAQIPRL